jgi:glycosyltransferase involved in cell wall biosynthesis
MPPRKLDDCQLIILHEYGAPGHYTGAVAAARELGIDRIEFIEFSVAKKLIRGILARDVGRVKKAVRDFFWLLLCFIWPKILKDKKIVVGIAPLDWRLCVVIRIIGQAKIVYHSSWTRWDGRKYAKKNYLLNGKVLSVWHNFLGSKVDHFALVTDVVGAQLTKHFLVAGDKQSVVYHAYDESIFFHDTKDKKNGEFSILFIGRLVASKGVHELLEIARHFPQCRFSVLGEGPMQSVIEKSGLANIYCYGFVTQKEEVARICKGHDVILLPSKRTSTWEELFGMALVEAMACGCVPLTTDHSGPLTIIQDDELRGLISIEADFVLKCKEKVELFRRDDFLLKRLQMKSALEASQFGMSNIAKIWKNVFDEL